MSNEIHPVKSTGNGGYERSDIGVSGVLYFLAGLVLAGLLTHFVVDGLYSFLEKRSESQQAPVSPLVTNAPKDTRKLSAAYKDYLKQNFPSPQLEVDERGQLDKIRTDEAQTLNSYDWVDQKAGTVRIPIDRAMDLLVERGLPVRAPSTSGEASADQSSKSQPEKPTEKKKESKK
jgi:hypothetical protein